ncbi:alpha/beta hydrolase [Nitrogeniibacter mangrovi]|uniref:Alpha/beta hydrolase n=1 Tax=Nitrogeniibacter mangrovi TaxID=2016596 RepID=A0A6C1B3N6_9RHOO|nr:alpha/beta hydrolase [Nitrogeniibacter mangrovi]QID18003.1 alpha/beta hydrolase [Nitrogeniibacter mangrovi]
MRRFNFLLALALSACAVIPTPGERRGQADALAGARGWIAQTLPAGPFDLLAYRPATPVPAEVLTIYVEGDGLAWLSRTQVSPDPTPIDPLALRLALAQPRGNAAYLARPCQYLARRAGACDRRDWTSMRFAPAVIDSTNRAIDRLKQDFGARQLVLVGYSGGGAVAALVAVRRHDVAALVTVAGNLDHRAWTRWHHVPALSGSLDPADEVDALAHVRQWHFAGEKDRIVPPTLIRGFVDRFPAAARPAYAVEPGVDHHDGWVASWPRLWRRVMQAEAVTPE